MKDKLSTYEAAVYCQARGIPFTKKTLEVWRCHGRGPAFYKIGRKIYYKKEDLDRFLEGERVETVDTLE